MSGDINFRIILQNPPTGVAFGIQSGSGLRYETLQTKKSTKGDLIFEFTVALKDSSGDRPNFSGKIVQGPADGRFVYIDIGTYAGEKDSVWSRRLKIPLTGITAGMVKKCLAVQNSFLETNVRGTAKDGGPNCGTAKPFDGWHVVEGIKIID